MPIKQIQYYSQLRYEGHNTIQKRLELVEEQMNRLNIEKSKIEDNIVYYAKLPK
jgi:hypothetical protein